MEGQYFLVDSNLLPSNPQNRFEMMNRIFSLPSSGKIKDHLMSCRWKEDCKICPKFRCLLEIFIKYEKDNNKKLDIGKFMDEDFVEDIIFKDDTMKIFNPEELGIK